MPGLMSAKIFSCIADTVNSTAVAVHRCTDYAPASVRQALEKVLADSGVMSIFNFSGKSVLLKPNLLRESLPEQCVCTHFEVVRQLGILLREAGAEVTVAESSGGRSYGKTIRAAETSGLLKALSEAGIPFVNVDTAGTMLKHLNGTQLENLVISELYQQFDITVSIPKMKTHVETRFTGAVKNMMGLVPGSGKLSMHKAAPKAHELGEAIVDLYSAVKPHFAVMDAIWAMEGDGPNLGTRRDAGMLICSIDAVALDSMASRLTGFHEQEVEYLWNAQSRGLGTADWSRIELCGDSVEVMKDFRHGAPSLTRKLPSWLLRFAARHLVSVDPEIVTDQCRQCGECASSCPVEAIVCVGARGNVPLQDVDLSADRPETVPVIDYKKCIRCLCCHELCPHQAVRLKKSLLLRLLTGK
ncbi:MAG: DUF362 domain-containing protein [Candidatus Wallbacteria bacterium]|nr:DUF362 domain-containing protein [Candidatus Wallbacteria bacterium]